MEVEVMICAKALSGAVRLSPALKSGVTKYFRHKNTVLRLPFHVLRLPLYLNFAFDLINVTGYNNQNTFLIQLTIKP
jgi:hypothetical protein